jgi:hypothetical protein
VGRLYVLRLELELGVNGNVSNPERTASGQSRLNLLNDFSCMSAHMLEGDTHTIPIDRWPQLSVSLTLASAAVVCAAGLHWGIHCDWP